MFSQPFLIAPQFKCVYISEGEFLVPKFGVRSEFGLRLPQTKLVPHLHTYLALLCHSNLLEILKHLTKLLKPIRTHDPDQNQTLELHSRAEPSVGVMSPFQRSQHRKQFWRKADKKIQLFY